MKDNMNKSIKIPSVSAIVPLYRCSKGITRCVESIINQTKSDLEIIIVSGIDSDNLPVKLKEIIKKDNRIRIIELPGGRYGEMVNLAVSEANGEYIAIVKADDFISNNMIEELYSLSADGTVDIIKGGFSYCIEEENKPPRAEENMDRNMIPDSTEPFTLCENAQISWGEISIWSALYRKEFLLENKIKFAEYDVAGEDEELFFYETLCKAKGIMWTRKPYYYFNEAQNDSMFDKDKDIGIVFNTLIRIIDIINENHANNVELLRCTYSRMLIYINKCREVFDYQANIDKFSACVNKLFEKVDQNVITSDFSLHEQFTYFKNLSPINKIKNKMPKVLIYNWLPFDNMWGWGGGVTIYCKNIIEEMIRHNPEISIYFLSSGFAYSADSDKTYVRKLGSIYGDKVHQYEIVNSPVPAEQRWMYVNPLVALENESLKNVVDEFIQTYGEFDAIHFNNIEGLSLDVLDLKEKYKNTRFIFSIHNYVPLCVNGSYYMRHKHCNCNPNHTGEDCIQCTRADIRRNVAVETYKRGLYGMDPQKCFSQNRWIKNFGFERLDVDATADNILDFANTAIAKLNKNCDTILAVSKRVYDIAVDNGFDKDKTIVNYIGTKVASRQIGHANCKYEDGLKIIFLGSDINYEEKGYPFLLDALSTLDPKYAMKIDMVLTVKQEQHKEIYDMLRNFRSVKVIQGYTHDDLPRLFKGCNLSIVPVLWEDNLPQIAIESVAFGVPVLASSAGGPSELCSSDLFKFECGNSKDLCAKIMHFIDRPEDLDEYWKNHKGLVTMDMHWKELSEIYGIVVDENIQIPINDIRNIIRENDFLLNNISIRDDRFATAVELQKLREKLNEANEQNEKLRLELKKMEKLSGKVIFQTEYDPVQGHVGANLFKLTVPEFEYSDFMAVIRFARLGSICPSVTDTLTISGTLLRKDENYKLSIHQIDWENGSLSDWIYYFIDGSSIIFFGRYPGRCSGYSYVFQQLSSRAANDDIKFEKLNRNFVYENELRNEDAFNTLEPVDVKNEGNKEIIYEESL